jgi:hypothetical protein
MTESPSNLGRFNVRVLLTHRPFCGRIRFVTGRLLRTHSQAAGPPAACAAGAV